MKLQTENSGQTHKSVPPGSQRAAISKYLFTALAVIALITGLYLLSRHNYTLFHSLADMITVFIAGSVFVVVWNGRRFSDNHFYLFVGIAFLSFALLDFMHLLGNKDMGVFPQYGNLGPTLYIASRYVLSLSLVIAPLFIKRKLNVTVTLAVYALVTIFILLSIFYWQNFPVTYIEGQGLTRFKIISDYVICLILAGAIGLLLINRRAFDPKVLRTIIYSLILSIATGLAFTLYTDPFGITNAVGHFLQIGAFYLVYRAFIETVMTKPQDILYRNLKQSKEEVLNLNAELQKVNLDLKQDIAKRQEAEAALRHSEEQLHVFIEHAPVAIAMFDSRMRYLAFSQRWIEDYGLTGQQIQGRSHYEVFPEIPERWKEIYRRCLAGATEKVEEDPFLRADGATQWLHWEIIPWYTMNKEIGGTIIFSEDITERRQGEEELQRYTRELEASNQEMETFSYSVSHDLRAPLRTMDGFSEAVLTDYGDKLDETGKDYLTRVRRASHTMAQLIDDILKLSRINRAEMHLESVNLSNLAHSITEELKATQPERQAEFIIVHGIIVKGDKNLLQIGLRNLLENSWKYTGKCSAARIEFGVQNQKGGKVCFIRDNGIGFDMQYAGKLFQPFQRLHTIKEYPGTGIGLATVQRVIRRHNGRIWAESEPGKGATFYFTLG